MHEIENALLDPPSLHAALKLLGRARSEDQLRKRLAEEATGACWGMALGSTLAWIRTMVQQEFPPSNGLVEVRDRAAALHCILGSKWWTELLPSIPTTLTRESVNKQLDDYFAAYSADLASGDFLTTFAGKELLGRCQSWLLQKGKGPHPTESDLAKAVGAAQRSTGNVPAEISSLLATLLSTL
jgi:hypothetical protein